MTIQSIIKEHLENSISQKVIETAVVRALGNINLKSQHSIDTAVYDVADARKNLI